MGNFCNVDGALVPEGEAVVPVLDRGFLFGDSVYEVIRTRNGCLFAWREHFERMRASAEALWMPLDLDDRTILQRVLATVAAAGNPEHYVRIVVTRGTGTAPSIDLAAATGPLRWIVFARPLPPGPATARVLVVDRLRNDRRALDPAVKSGNYLNNVMGLAEAKKAGATDCLMLNADGNVTEASTSNVVVVKDGVHRTPPLRAGILAGITRALWLDFLRERGERIEEVDVTRRDLETADAIALTSTLRDVSPVTHLDGRELPQTKGLARLKELAADFTAVLDARARDVDHPAALRAAGAR